MNKTIKGACLVAATAMLPLSQAATAGEVNISGWINESMLYYDDGQSSDVVAVQDNGTTLASRLSFTGSHELPSSGLTAGFEFTVEPSNTLQDDNGLTPLLSSQNATAVNAATGSTAVAALGDNNAFGSDIGLLASNLYVSGSFGKITLGTQSMPTDNIAVLSDPSLTLWSGISPVFRGAGFAIQGLGAGATKTAWGSFLACNFSGLGIGFDCNGVYRTGIRYDLPAIAGVKVAVGYANDDIYDISVNYSGSVAGLNAVLGMGYAINQGGGNAHISEAEVFQVQGGLMDPNTGIFGSVAYMNDQGDLNAANRGTTASDEVDSYFIKVGIKRAFNALGDTAFAFKYGSYNDAFGAADTGVTGSEVERLGFEVVQYFGAGFQIYGTWEQLDLDVDCGGTAAASATCTTNYGGADELDMFSLGATYFF